MSCVLEGKKLELEYPCSWEYKLIGLSQDDISKAVSEVLLEREHSLVPSKTSKKGNFSSFNLSLLVHNEDDRVALYELFNQHNLVKMVI